MDEKLIQEIMSFLSKWYIWEIIILILAILLTMVVKIPIKKAAVKWQDKYGIDKSKITWVNAVFPYIFCFIMVFILFWYKANWNLELKDPDWWKSVGMRTATLGSGAIGLYELIKKCKEAVIATHQKKVLDKKNKESNVVELPIHGTEVVEQPVKLSKKARVLDEPKVEAAPIEKPTRH